MRIKPIELKQTNKIAADYRKNAMSDFFAYTPFDYERERILDIKKRPFPRLQLAELLREINASWDAPTQTMAQINRLHDEDSVVVIGGQQAGLLTGPLYTVNKIVSIIAYAKEQERKLRIPVIPIFWIAGEDHDYDEINHIFTIHQNKLMKRKTTQQEYVKKSVSHLSLDKEKTEAWLKLVFNDLEETEYTKILYQKITATLEKSQTFVDFCARIVFELFPEEGLVLIDSAHPKLRQYESMWFQQLIEHQPDITAAIYETAQNIQYLGYPLQVDVEKDDANLFFHDDNNERILLKREQNEWIGKNNEIALTTEELLTIAKEQPEKLSNNVMTRPLMQEAIFPTLAFIAGDGEISYWALLKQAFQAFDSEMKMPPVVPRLSFTFVTKRMDKLLNDRVLRVENVVNNGCEDLRLNWLTAQQNPPVPLLFEEVKNKFNSLHIPLRELAQSIGSDLGAEAERNWEYILKNITYLEQKTMKYIEKKYEFELEQFAELNHSLRPNNQLQERVWNVLPLLNECGPSVLLDLIDYSYSFKEHHYLVFVN